jgi:N-carbamoyl-L-amino-acid hydrolase
MSAADVTGRLAQAAGSVSKDRLWRRHLEMSRIGATGRGGLNRLALTPEDGQAQALIAGWAAARGYTTTRDAAGNVFIRREGSRPDAPAVMTGSHLDSQPNGGCFDGTYGVLAGFEVLEALDDAGIATPHPIEVVAWMNEEGSRFVPGAMGSAAFTGFLPLQDVLEKKDAAGVTVREALARIDGSTPLAARAPGPPPAAYVEAHIEQGPILESRGDTIGVVTGIQGIRRFAVEVLGEEGHAGTTPRASRKDALSAAVALISALERLTADAEDQVRFTVGRMAVEPNSPNTIPGKVTFSIDLRHPSKDLLARTGDLIHATVSEVAASRRVDAKVQDISFVAPTTFLPLVPEAVRSAASAEGLPHHVLPSGAGHDAMHLSRICPTGMVFIPCLNGRSHTEVESATPEDLFAGARVLARVIAELALQSC